ncbi:protein STRUBBELIG-RECEPTOR FAMILY [Striga asiatica]|uniref:Protein STRUBBELIG-RECEPTOR FAMILY n=1 Tax=Striga asiatica TaxID=4170 RepID=A0A5A7P6E2_STRAF|nr:protein STRUBBELIG-RECEPTOR FAMILY [Striga asiatica]
MRRVKEMETVVFVALLICTLSLSFINADTDPNDAAAINALYTGLNQPSQLSNWNPSSQDPCGQNWEGITCSGSRIAEIRISSKGLTGNMGYQLDRLTFVTTLNLANCGFSGSGGLPYSISQMRSLEYLNVSHNNIQGQVNIQSNLSALTTLDLSNNQLSDNLPQSFQFMTSIQNMYLQNNQFTGTLDVLTNLPLKTLNVENNRFTGWVPQQLRGINLHLNGNQLSSEYSPPPPPGTPAAAVRSNRNRAGDSSSSGIGGGAIAGIVVSILVIGAIITFFVIKKRSRKKADTDIENIDNLPFAPLASSQDPKGIIKPVQTSTFEAPGVTKLKPPPFDHRHKESFDNEKDVSVMTVIPPKKVNRSPIDAKLFSVADLQMATDSFNADNLIGEGSIGRVYRAQLDDGRVVAVKKINSSAFSNSEDFLDIVAEISRLKNHPNVTELIGYCSEHDQNLLIYEFHKNGSLHEFLHIVDEFSSEPLTWSARVKIALGTARALEYLHEVCSPSVIHKNFKSANILLDVELNPQLSDCLLASLVREPDQASGYSAPEVALSGQHTIKSDVYSFGVVMLELLTGRTPFDSSRPRTEQSLVRWATPQLHDIDALSKMVDPSLKGLYPVKSLSRFADVIALCVQAPINGYVIARSHIEPALIPCKKRGLTEISRAPSAFSGIVISRAPSDLTGTSISRDCSDFTGTAISRAHYVFSGKAISRARYVFTGTAISRARYVFSTKDRYVFTVFDFGYYPTYVIKNWEARVVVDDGFFIHNMRWDTPRDNANAETRKKTQKAKIDRRILYAFTVDMIKPRFNINFLSSFWTNVYQQLWDESFEYWLKQHNNMIKPRFNINFLSSFWTNVYQQLWDESFEYWLKQHNKHAPDLTCMPLT